MDRWTQDRTGSSYTSIVGMDPRADCLLGPGFDAFQPGGPNALIPFTLSVQSPEALQFLNAIVAAGPANDRNDQDGPAVLPVRFPALRPAEARVGVIPTLMAPLTFFQELARPEGRFQQFRLAAKQIQLSLPVNGPSMPNWRPGAPLPPPPVDPQIGPPDDGWPQGTVVVGMIDDGIAFANARFRLADNTSRVQCFWHQDGFPVSPTVPYGRETLKAEIDGLLATTMTAGVVDEEAVYQLSELVDFTQPLHKAAALRLAHGTHVLDLAAGEDPNISRTDRPIIAVQLPVAATANQSGAGLESWVKDAIAYIQSRAILLAGKGPGLPVVINFSYATVTGPKDGTSLLEQVVDQAVATAQPETRIVLPAGNDNLTRGHEETTFRRWHRTASLHWRKQPDDLTLSMAQVWLPYAGPAPPPASRIWLSIVTPDGVQSPPLGEVNGQGIVLLRNGEIICCARYSFQPAPTERGVFNICLQPTVRLLPTAPANLKDRIAPSGVWTIRLHNVLLRPHETVNTWIERDDLIYGYPRRGRQSYFDEASYEIFNPEGFVVDEDADQPPSPVRRDGMVNAIATGASPAVLGGFIRKDLHFSLYAAGGPISPTRGGALNPAFRKPDAASVSDDSRVHYGVLATGSRSGSAVPMAGTSVAAPQLTRWVADQLAIAAPSDRAGVRVLAIAAEAALPASKPPLVVNRGGWGRIDFPATMAGPRTRYWP